ncbi:hypothetical protein [Capnocytophaga leadbetteri]|jgi:hypothetical protein|uniref:hypothetical protein n=1 Tax=Capnocytophaga leadbetteri TaxID=327575 RepID=UPI0026EFF833|nr:hypothetical protein [Capnocytophaga leadbetteri]
MPAIATTSTTTTNRKASSSKGLSLVMPKKKATTKKKETIEELGERAQKIARKYNMKPFERTNFYATYGNM